MTDLPDDAIEQVKESHNERFVVREKHVGLVWNPYAVG